MLHAPAAATVKIKRNQAETRSSVDAAKITRRAGPRRKARARKTRHTLAVWRAYHGLASRSEKSISRVKKRRVSWLSRPTRSWKSRAVTSRVKRSCRLSM
ncbi:MAG: hypothetical protein DMF81_17130 [Acidobacteria bacterium]|nr:MAG: hypothetical protein DMF81_17130 [Acidobacteriota bacterium]